LDAVAGEQFAQASVVDVGEGVVGLQAPGGDAVTGEEPERALDERGDGGRLLVGVQFGVDQAGVVVDDRVAELPADAGLLLDAGGGAIAGHLVPGPGEPGQAFGVHLQQITGARPFEPTDLLAGRPWRARDAAPCQTAADGRVRHAELAGDQPRAPAGPLARGTDAVMHRL
jgi:hypothetical protein